MAIAFNLPSEREANEENFSRLNRLLAELYEVLCHILQPGPEARDNRRDRPYSESDVERPSSSAVQLPCRMSASSPPVTVAMEPDIDDDVFVSPRSDIGNDPFSTRNLEIFGTGAPRTPAGVLLSPRRDRTFTFSLTSEKQWRDKGGTVTADVADGVPADADETDSISSSPAVLGEDLSLPRLITSIIPAKVSGSICTAILIMVGWKLLSR